MSKTCKYGKEQKKIKTKVKTWVWIRQKKKILAECLEFEKQTMKAPENTKLLLQNLNSKYWDLLYCTSCLLYSRGQADALEILNLV